MTELYVLPLVKQLLVIINSVYNGKYVYVEWPAVNQCGGQNKNWKS